MGQAGMELRRKADSSCLPLTAIGFAAEGCELAAVKSCLLRVAVRVGRLAPSRAPWRAHGVEDEGVHFVKSALNVRFDGFCVLTTDLLGLSVRPHCD